MSDRELARRIWLQLVGLARFMPALPAAAAIAAPADPWASIEFTFTSNGQRYVFRGVTWKGLKYVGQGGDLESTRETTNVRTRRARR
jgi:hypothetical protein